MNGRIAKALRREANQFALQSGRTQPKQEILIHEKLSQITLPELDSKGRLQHRVLRDKREQIVWTDGPRFFYLRLKQAFRRGLLRVTGQEVATAR